MKKGIMTAVLSGIMLMAAGIGTMAEEAMPDIENLFYTYSKDNLVFDYKDDEYLNGWNLQQKGYNGFLSLKQVDLNWDGEEELLAIRIKEEIEDNGEEQTVYFAEVYQYQGDRLQRIAQKAILKDVICENSINTDFFLKDTDDATLLVCESRETQNLFADGVKWQLRVLEFDGSELVERGSAGLVGSAWDPADEDPAYQVLNSVGLYPEQIVYTTICEQCYDTELLNSVTRRTTIDYTDLQAYRESGEQGDLLYGYTLFYSFVNEEESKINDDFVTILHGSGQTQNAQAAAEKPAVENKPAQTNATENVYVLPDSDSRYISESELAKLSEYGLLLARNEFYAKHGRIFKNEELNNYFRSQSWYQPTVSGDDFTEEYAASVFNEYEVENLRTIIAYEKAHDLNQN